MTYEYNIAPKENLPTVARKATVTNIHFDTISKRINLGLQISLIDINNEPVGQPEYLGGKSLNIPTGIGEIVPIELQAKIDFEKQVVENPKAVDLNTAIKNILENNSITII